VACRKICAEQSVRSVITTRIEKHILGDYPMRYHLEDNFFIFFF